MANTFGNAENKVDAERKRKEKVKLLEELVRRFTTKKSKEKGLTEEEDFLLEYYDVER